VHSIENCLKNVLENSAHPVDDHLIKVIITLMSRVLVGRLIVFLVWWTIICYIRGQVVIMRVVIFIVLSSIPVSSSFMLGPPPILVLLWIMSLVILNSHVQSISGCELDHSRCLCLWDLSIIDPCWILCNRAFRHCKVDYMTWVVWMRCWCRIRDTFHTMQKKT